MFRIIVKCYNPQGHEVFPEREVFGDSYAEAVDALLRGLGVAPFQIGPVELTPQAPMTASAAEHSEDPDDIGGD